MFSSWSINKPHFYSAVPQGYFLLLWFHNAVLSCALMLIWKFDALHAWFSPIAAQGQNKPLPLTFPFDLAPQLFLCSLSSPSTAWFFLSLSPFSFSSALQMCKKKNYRLMCASVTCGTSRFQKGASEKLMSPLHEKFTLGWPFRCHEALEHGFWVLLRNYLGKLRHCPKMHLVFGLGHFLWLFFPINHWFQWQNWNQNREINE